MNTPLPRRISSAAASQWAMQVDPVGDRLQLLLTAGFLFAFPINPHIRDWLCGMAVFMLLLRLPKIARCYGSIWNTPFAWAAGAYLAWMTLGLLWAPDAYLGLELLGTQRMLLIPLLLWPVLAHVRVLVLSFLAGVFVLNSIQLVQWVTEDALRVEGTNNAIKTGLYCGIAACAWAQIAVATCRHRHQLLVSLAAMMVALVGLVLSGSRGPIAAVVLSLPLLAVISFALYPMLRRRIVLVACILCIGAGSIGALKWDYISFRFGTSVNQYSESGVRGQMIEHGLATFMARPLLGTGSGNASRDLEEGVDLHGMRGEQVHFHCTYVFALATLGIPGLLVLLGVLVAGLWYSWPNATGPPMMCAVFICMVIWSMAAWFDSYQASGAYLGVLGVLLGFAMWDGSRSSTNVVDGAV